ncbi:MAG: transaldolase [Alphaproteobacteria bacterium]|uniref:Transaldolase n=1 Tax=Candidatus Nitrobium versatile TaxID=2884831 RepID=A0A953M171_9BACT|nr:transaldolase [Candidatus Nitrobium versatile]
MKPDTLKSKIFLDGGNPDETKEIIRLLGFLDGQTTNPTLISKNPRAKEHLEHGGTFTEEEIMEFYREVVTRIASMIPRGTVSVEVYADPSTKAEEMLSMGRKMFSWIPNAHVKFPASHEGLKAAEQAVREEMRVNMTLCFSQEQAAAVYAATRGAKRGDVFVSPFIGRLDDRGENGMDLIEHVLAMYRKGDGHVEVLTASVRNPDHLLYALKLGSDIITAPYEILKEWGERGLPLPDEHYRYETKGLRGIPYKDIDLTKNWQEYDLRHDLTVKGMEKFSQDWNAMIGRPAVAQR